MQCNGKLGHRKPGNDKRQTWFDLLKTQELSHQMHKKIIEHCKRRKIIFLSTPYDEESVDMLEKFKINNFRKILKKIKKESFKRNIDPKITHRIWKNMIWSYINFEKKNFKKK